MLAVDRLVDLGGTLAGISPETMQKLDAALPPIWSQANPVDIAGDADAARYAAAFEALLADPENDAILVMNVPTALASATGCGTDRSPPPRRRTATSLIRPKPVFAVWVGSSDAVTPNLRSRRHSRLCDRIRRGPRLHASRALPGGARRPDGDAAEPAAGFHAGRRRRPRDVDRGCGGSAERTWLDPIEVTRLLAAYSIPIAPALLARDADEAAAVARPIAGRGIDRGREDPVAGYRAQIRCRRRAARI